MSLATSHAKSEQKSTHQRNTLDTRPQLRGRWFPQRMAQSQSQQKHGISSRSCRQRLADSSPSPQCRLIRADGVSASAVQLGQGEPRLSSSSSYDWGMPTNAVGEANDRITFPHPFSPARLLNFGTS
ncbi:hypothetical protein MN608_05861 [Microdochium nivale]|nr:hypothetical protein MN608_05861 [Microdochium nivale]